MANDNINAPDLRLDVVVYRDGDDFIAHCLQLDIVGSARNQDDAVEEVVDLVEEAIIHALQDNDLEHLFKFAPLEIFQRFQHSHTFTTITRRTQVNTTHRIDSKNNGDVTPVSFRVMNPDAQAVA